MNRFCAKTCRHNGLSICMVKQHDLFRGNMIPSEFAVLKVQTDCQIPPYQRADTDAYRSCAMLFGKGSFAAPV